MLTGIKSQSVFSGGDVPLGKGLRRKRHRDVKKIKLASWNLQGKLSELSSQIHLTDELRALNVEICALQETNTREDFFGPQGDYDFIVLAKHQKVGSGLGFALSKAVSGCKEKILVNEERVLALSFFNWPKKGARTVIINVHAPTMSSTTRDVEGTVAFYEALDSFFSQFSSFATVLVVGDFNGRLGIRQPDDVGVGPYTHGEERNANGDFLVDFMGRNNLAAANTYFRVSICRRITYVGPRVKKDKVSGEMVSTLAQIDFILVPNCWVRQGRVTLVRSHRRVKYLSDHRILVATLSSPGHVLRLAVNRLPPLKLLSRAIKSELDVYKCALGERLRDQIAEIVSQPSQDRAWKIFRGFMAEAAETAVKEDRRAKLIAPSPMRDFKFKELHDRQAALILRLSEVGDLEEGKALRRQRNINTKQLRFRCKSLRAAFFQKVAQLVPDPTDGFAAVHTLLGKRKWQRFELEDVDGHRILSSSLIKEALVGHVTQLLHSDDPGLLGLNIFDGPSRPLNNPISVEEVSAATYRMQRHKATGPDTCPAEALRFGGGAAWIVVARLLNRIFEEHALPKDFLDQTLIPLNKPAKPKTTEFVRTISLLNTSYKTLGIVFLIRCLSLMVKYAAEYSFGFVPDRAKNHILWAYEFLQADALKHQRIYKALGVDISKAYDNTPRMKLLAVLQDRVKVGEDELRIARILLAPLRSRIKVAGSLSKCVLVNKGVPQGAGASPMLFLVYLQAVVYDLLPVLDDAERSKLLLFIFADDLDFIHHLLNNQEDAFIVKLKKKFLEWGFHLNDEKMEQYLISAARFGRADVKKLGVFLDSGKQVKAAMGKARRSFTTAWPLWHPPNRISLSDRLRLYVVLIRGHLTRDMELFWLPRKQLRALEGVQRYHLRRIFRIFYPNRIRNLYLYQKAKLQPVELSITKTRWRLFFKMLQLQPPHQIHCIMEEYFHKPIRQPGAPASSVRRSTLPWALHKELQLIGKSLLSWDDFQTIRNLAAHPEEWRVMVKKIVRKMKRRFFFQEDRDYKRGRKARMKAKQKRLREEREAMLGRTREAGPARSSCRGRRRGPRFSRI